MAATIAVARTLAAQASHMVSVRRGARP